MTILIVISADKKAARYAGHNNIIIAKPVTVCQGVRFQICVFNKNLNKNSYRIALGKPEKICYIITRKDD